VPNYRLVIEYDGREYAGFQTQPDRATVQSTLEAALSQHFERGRVIVHGSGRTDAGVHALGQVVNFVVDVDRHVERIRLGLNTILPPSIAVVDVRRVPDSFHARFSAVGKTYRYRIFERPDRSPFLAGVALHSRRPLDWSAVETALPALVGTHDFSAFRGAGCSAHSPVRTIDRAEHVDAGAGEHHLFFHGNGFLRYQVRKMVGTLLEIGLGRRAPASLAEVLASRNPARSGKTAHAQGLCLMSVDYPPDSLCLDEGAPEGPTVR
jgi:tRNA pseudouridine38-40 synthase